MAKAIRPPEVPEAPSYLAGALRDRWDELAPVFARMGTLSYLETSILAKYIVAENNYLQASNQLQKAMGAADGEDAAKWVGVQDKLLKQILTLGEALGLTAEKRKAMGWTLPK